MHLEILCHHDNNHHFLQPRTYQMRLRTPTHTTRYTLVHSPSPPHTNTLSPEILKFESMMICSRVNGCRSMLEPHGVCEWLAESISTVNSSYWESRSWIEHLWISYECWCWQGHSMSIQQMILSHILRFAYYFPYLFVLKDYTLSQRIVHCLLFVYKIQPLWIFSFFTLFVVCLLNTLVRLKWIGFSNHTKFIQPYTV